MSQNERSTMGTMWRNAPTTGVEVDGTRFVYRQLGPDTGVPVTGDYPVGAQFQCESEIPAILFRQRRDRKHDAGYVDTFAFRQLAAD